MSETTQAWKTPLALIPDLFRLKKIKDPSGNIKTWNEVYNENPNYEIYTDINGKPINPNKANIEIKELEMDAPGVTTLTGRTPAQQFQRNFEYSLQNPANPYSATKAGLGTMVTIAGLATGFATTPLGTVMGITGDLLGLVIGYKSSDKLFQNPDKLWLLNVDTLLTPREAMRYGTGFVLGGAMGVDGSLREPILIRNYNTYKLAKSLNNSGKLPKNFDIHSIERFKVGDLEVNDPNLNYRLGNNIVKDFFISKKVRTKNSNFSKPHFNQGGFWSHRNLSLKPTNISEVLVTRELLLNRSEGSTLGELLDTRRFPYSEKQLNKNNTSAYIWEDNYGWRDVLKLDQHKNYLGDVTEGSDYFIIPNHLDYGPRIGFGGEQTVFKSKTNPNIVHKVVSEDGVFTSPSDITNSNWSLRNENPSSLPIKYKGFFIDRKSNLIYPSYTLKKIIPIGDDNMSYEQFIPFLELLKKDMLNKGWKYENGNFTNGYLKTTDINPGNLGIDNGVIKIIDGLTTKVK